MTLEQVKKKFPIGAFVTGTPVEGFRGDRVSGFVYEHSRDLRTVRIFPFRRPAEDSWTAFPFRRSEDSWTACYTSNLVKWQGITWRRWLWTAPSGSYTYSFALSVVPPSRDAHQVLVVSEEGRESRAYSVPALLSRVSTLPESFVEALRHFGLLKRYFQDE